jgi:hypothetical protein
VPIDAHRPVSRPGSVIPGKLVEAFINTYDRTFLE